VVGALPVTETYYAVSPISSKPATDYFFFEDPVEIFFEELGDAGTFVDFEGLIDPVEKPLLSKVLPVFLSTQP
jgi:hypothetical protein